MYNTSVRMTLSSGGAVLFPGTEADEVPLSILHSQSRKITSSDAKISWFNLTP
jgi:hypothetical protein